MKDDSAIPPPPLSRREFLERGSQVGASLGLLGVEAAARLTSILRSDERSPVQLRANDDSFSLENSLIAAEWTTSGGILRARGITGHRGGSRNRLDVPAHAFEITLADGTRLPSTALRIATAATRETLPANPRASRAAERLAGQRLTVNLTDPNRRLDATWRAELREGSHYIRQEVTLRATGAPLAVREIVLVDLREHGAQATGTVRGSPVTIGQWFVGFEHPLSVSTVDGERVRCALPRELPLRPESPFTVSSVIGTARPGQMRRDFLAYVERERAHPYRTFLHYNSWYDIAYGGKYSEPEALGVIEIFGEELVRKRGVTLDSFLFDDGWDDPHSLWDFHAGFPNGFGPLRDAAARYGAAPGIWFSPWGGYSDAKQQRLEYGRQQGFETNEGGFTLSGPKYYQRFHDTCVRMVRAYGVNQFKIDGTGNASRAFPGSIFDSDFDAAIHLIEDLRVEKPDIFINLTTGTYPSPFWLRYADSIWRGGEDHSFAGVGSNRQQWMTYRDGATYTNTVQRGSLYPLNSLMLHGLIYARHADRLDTDPLRDFFPEVQSYFGTGTHLQEMYVTASLPQDYWDHIARHAAWSRRNADTLLDTHWLGGDPNKLEAYGWAAWSPAHGIVTLRNPSDKAQRFALDIARAFELPGDAAPPTALRDPWSPGRAPLTPVRPGGTEYAIDLQPFQVITLETQSP